MSGNQNQNQKQPSSTHQQLLSDYNELTSSSDTHRKWKPAVRATKYPLRHYSRSPNWTHMTTHGTYPSTPEPSYINTPDPNGGKKKVRKHKGIVQTGGKKGKLRKGYRYSGKKLKSGLPQIIKCKSKKC